MVLALPACGRGLESEDMAMTKLMTLVSTQSFEFYVAAAGLAAQTAWLGMLLITGSMSITLFVWLSFTATAVMAFSVANTFKK